MPKVNIQGVGTVNFPDSMTPEQITQAIETEILPQQQPEPQASAQPTTAPAKDPGWKDTPVGGFLRGLRDIPDAGAQLMTRGLEAIAPAGSGMEQWAKGEREKVEAINKEAEREYREEWRPPEQNLTSLVTGQTQDRGMDWGRLAGNIAATAPVVAAVPGAGLASLKARIGYGAATGAGVAALQPVKEGEEFWSEKGKQVTVGAGVGAAAPLVLGAAARLIKPNTRPEVTQLMDEGVTPTPGQIMGGAAQRAEEGLTSVPIIGDFVKGAQRRAVEDFNRSAIDRVLAPIGQKIDKKLVGFEAVEKAGEAVSKAYDDLLPKLKVVADDVFVNEVNTVRQMATKLPDAQAKQFEAILKQDIIGKFTSSGRMTGETMKEVESNLGRMIRQYGRSENPDHRLLSDAMKEAQAALRRMVERANPDYAGQLKKVNEAYANLLRVENAAGRLGSKEGVFSPAALRGAVKATDSSLRKRQFSRGNALMQDLAQAGEKVLGANVPDSGTAFRLMTPLALTGGAGLAAGQGWIPPEAALLIAAGSGAYSRPMQQLAATMLTKRPDMATPMAEGVRKLAPMVAAGSPLLYANQK